MTLFIVINLKKDFWQGVENSSNIVSISPPTSAGKSFIVQNWLKMRQGNLILNNENMTEAEALQWLNDNIQRIEENNLLPKLLINEINDILDAYNF